MKAITNRNLLRIFTTLILGMALISCSTDDDANQDNEDGSQEITDANSIVTTGNWRISSYIDDGDDETSDFNGYVFTFNSDGSLVASNGATQLEGTWSIQDDDSSSDDDDSDIDFNIFFAVSEDNDFDDLVDDWDLISISENTIRLKDDSDDDPEIDLLTFTKI